MSAVFRYFALPHQFSTYQETPRRCDGCGREAPGYAGPFYGKRDVEFVCEDCLSSGRLQQYAATTNEGDIAALLQQLRELRADVSDAERGRLALKRTTELQCGTPRPVTWQDFVWPAHCGDYCCFIKEIGRPELVRLALDGDGEAYFAAHAYDCMDKKHARTVWDNIRPDIPTDARNAYSAGVYLYRCLSCDEHVLLWDSD